MMKFKIYKMQNILNSQHKRFKMFQKKRTVLRMWVLNNYEGVGEKLDYEIIVR